MRVCMCVHVCVCVCVSVCVSRLPVRVGEVKTVSEDIGRYVWVIRQGMQGHRVC